MDYLLGYYYFHWLFQWCYNVFALDSRSSFFFKPWMFIDNILLPSIVSWNSWCLALTSSSEASYHPPVWTEKTFLYSSYTVLLMTSCSWQGVAVYTGSALERAFIAMFSERRVEGSVYVGVLNMQWLSTPIFSSLWMLSLIMTLGYSNDRQSRRKETALCVELNLETGAWLLS